MSLPENCGSSMSMVLSNCLGGVNSIKHKVDREAVQRPRFAGRYQKLAKCTEI